MKYKIGDRVKLINNNAGSYNHIGDIGTIYQTQSVDAHTWFRVRVKNRVSDCNWSFPEDLQLLVSDLNKNIMVL